LLSAAAVPFLAAFAKNAADDAYKAMKQFVGGVWTARRRADELAGHSERSGSLQLGDPESDVIVELEEDLPLDSYRALFQLDWGTSRPGVFRYDRGSRQWRDPAREWGQLPAAQVSGAFRAAVASYIDHRATRIEQLALSLLQRVGLRHRQSDSFETVGGDSSD